MGPAAPSTAFSPAHQALKSSEEESESEIKERHWWQQEERGADDRGGSNTDGRVGLKRVDGRALLAAAAKAAAAGGLRSKRILDFRTTVDADVVMGYLGGVGVRGRMEGQTIVYLDSVVEPSPVPATAAEAVAKLLSKCTIFAKHN